ncbi:Rrn9p [Saccharomyces cerevisiae x Saccharomyces kudriavzevii VIN7]|uniref:Rrn9p n=1 Tax=Saccharomyces cerevisiae x Saccharomyces kudriavzevii (strain VIN7) TaxID=1095631 RepID=H0GZN6_SACCK|nr:Rrn9p [Saccharomyces cerevisiae x Saccharomyces kudriavzevii VIN7]
MSDSDEEGQIETQIDAPIENIIQGSELTTTTADKGTLKAANELLDSLEHSHRGDLSLHLYSAYLLKKLLYRANERKHFYEVNQFVKTQIKDNWTSWPSPNTIIDPRTDRLYEDIPEGIESVSIPPGEVSDRALIHASDMMTVELGAQWQKCLSKSAFEHDVTLDVDELNIPIEISQNILVKLDSLFEGLHDRIAKENEFDVRQDTHSNNINVSQIDDEPIQANRRIKFTYHDIISRGCEMNEDMTEIYMKSLELFNDIPEKFKRSKFKLSKRIMKKYNQPKKTSSYLKELLSKTREEYIPVEKLLKDKRLTSKDKSKLQRLNREETEDALNKRTFFQVKGYSVDEDEISDYDLDDCLIEPFNDKA